MTWDALGLDHRCALLAGCASILAGCGSAPEPTNIAIPAAPSASASAVSANAPSTPSASRPAKIAWPSKVACELSAEHAFLDVPAELRFARDAAPFATARLTDRVKLRIAVTSAAPDGVLEVSSNGLTVRGVVDTTSIRVHPARATKLGDFYVPGPSASLALSSSRMGSLDVTPMPKEDLHPNEPIVGSVVCADVTLGDSSFEPADALGTKPGKAALLLPGTVALSVTDGGPTVATVDVARGKEPSADVYASSKTMDQVGFLLGEDLVFGWVPQSAIRVVAAGSGHGYGFGRGDGVGWRHKRSREITCSDALEAIAEVGSERRVVGEIAAHTTIQVVSEQDGEMVVEVQQSRIALAPGTTLLARDETGSCREAVPEKNH